LECKTSNRNSVYDESVFDNADISPSLLDMAFSAVVEMASVKMAFALEALGPVAAKKTRAKAACPIRQALPIQPKLKVMPQGEAMLAEGAA
jgi:hypothetical protein